MSHLIKDNTLGNPIRASDFGDFSVAAVRYAPEVRLPSHAHDFTYLSLVLRGGFEESVGSNTASARSASVVVMPQGVTHGECIGPMGARSVTVALRATFPYEPGRGRQPLLQWQWFHGGPVARSMLDIYREHLLADEPSGCGLCELLLELCELIAGQREVHYIAKPRCVRVAVELLHARCTDGMRLAEIAAELGTDVAYLARAFRRQMGCTMSQYRRHLWVREAAHLLASTEASLSDVALKAGFADQSHLCRVFKAEMGMTPQAYRALTGATRAGGETRGYR